MTAIPTVVTEIDRHGQRPAFHLASTRVIRLAAG